VAKRTIISPAIDAERQKRNGPHSPWKRMRKAPRRAEAEARQAARDERGDAAQLLRLDDLFGFGMGAKRERARLLNRITRAA